MAVDMSELYVSWADYHQAIELLAARIGQSEYKFDQIICIARGGLRVGDVLSRIFQQPLAILATSSYCDATRERSEIAIASQITTIAERLGERVLLVDDLVDSGVTLQQTIDWLKQRYPHIESVYTAVIWYKARSIYVPDFYVSYLADDPWIHQPFEIYDRNYKFLTI